MNILTLNEDLKASFCLQLLIRVELHKMVIPVGPEANNFAFIEMGSYIFTCPERRIIRQPVTKKNLFYFKVYKYKSNLYRCKYIYLKKKIKEKMKNAVNSWLGVASAVGEPHASFPTLLLCWPSPFVKGFLMMANLKLRLPNHQPITSYFRFQHWEESGSAYST